MVMAFIEKDIIACKLATQIGEKNKPTSLSFFLSHGMFSFFHLQPCTIIFQTQIAFPSRNSRIRFLLSVCMHLLAYRVQIAAMILVMAVLGIARIGLFKILGSPRLRRPLRLLNRGT